jgi:hypothetical protein
VPQSTGKVRPTAVLARRRKMYFTKTVVLAGKKNVFYEKRNSDRGVYILENECRLRIRSARFVTLCRM